MRYINVNQAVTNPSPVDIMPQSLERGSLSRTQRAISQQAKGSLFFIAGPSWYASHRNGPGLSTVIILAFFTKKKANFCAKFSS